MAASAGSASINSLASKMVLCIQDTAKMKTFFLNENVSLFVWKERLAQPVWVNVQDAHVDWKESKVFLTVLLQDARIFLESGNLFSIQFRYIRCGPPYNFENSVPILFLPLPVLESAKTENLVTGGADGVSVVCVDLVYSGALSLDWSEIEKIV